MVSNDEIKHLGWLSRLELADGEITRYASQIKEIIGYLDKLDSISLAEIDNAVSFGADVLGLANKRKDGFVKGPRMV
jgi:Asp-tRNA(Asn)/Glu-tRNA(Gln) amidotransferase C subunit